MFKFGLKIDENGKQVVDRSVWTPFANLSGVEMMEYIDVDNELCHQEILQKREKWKTKAKQRKIKSVFNNLVFGITLVATIWFLVSWYDVLTHNLDSNPQYHPWNLIIHL